MKKPELVFIPLAASSHLTGSIQFAKSLLDQDEHLSITVLIILLPPQTDLDPYTKSIVSSNSNIKFIIIPPAITSHIPQPFSSSICIEMFVHRVFESHKPQVELVIKDLVLDVSTQLVGVVLDMFSSCMIDVANKFKVPSYMFCSFSTAYLGFLLHLPDRHNQVGDNFHPSDSDSVIPSFQNHVPANVLPGAVFDKSGGGYESYVYFGTRFKECKGFIVNSFAEVEPYALYSIVTPPNVYPVGPLIEFKNRNDSSGSTESEIKNWLDNQPLKSVLFLCFGTMGYFNESQLAQIAIALERSGHRFLWSIRQPPRDGNVATSDYTNVQKVLPDGFLERVKERGMVCGWAPQAEVLAHGAVKGFVSHCGWNSVLESLWYNVPIATWPLHAEQQLNAFLLVKELELAVELNTWKWLSDDILYNQHLLKSPELSLTEDQIKNLTLFEIENILLGNNSSLRKYQTMPFPDAEYISIESNSLIQEELSYDHNMLKVEFLTLFYSITNEQKNVFDRIMMAVQQNKGGGFFIYGYGGTGKTYLWKTLSTAIRSKGEIVLIVASSGIASLLLTGGRTAHSRFHITINLNEDSTCYMDPGTDEAQLLEKNQINNLGRSSNAPQTWLFKLLTGL